MKKMIAILAVLAITAFMTPSLFAWGGNPDNQTVDGNASIGLYKPHHVNKDTGGVSSGNANGSYEATDPNFAAGSTHLDGEVMGDDFQGSHKAWSYSGAEVNADANTVGKWGSTHVDGLVQQENWATVNDEDGAGATGWNYSTADFDANGQKSTFFWLSWGDTDISGGADVLGGTIVSANSNGEFSIAKAATGNMANAWRACSGGTNVEGTGSILTGASAYKKSGNSEAVAGAVSQGSFEYSGNHSGMGGTAGLSMAQVEKTAKGMKASSSAGSVSAASSS